jgi:hypothetical protein
MIAMTGLAALPIHLRADIRLSGDGNRGRGSKPASPASLAHTNIRFTMLGTLTANSAHSWIEDIAQSIAYQVPPQRKQN